MAFPTFIGARYIRSKKKRTISAITAIAITGVALGVAALSVVISISTGFQDEFIKKVLGVNAHVLVMKYGFDFREYRSVMETVRKLPEVRGAAPFVIQEMMISKGDHTAAILLKGVDPDLMSTVLDLPSHIVKGGVEGLRVPGSGPPHVRYGRGSTSSLSEQVDDLLAGDAGPDARMLPGPDGPDRGVATVFTPLGAGIRWGAVVTGTTDGDVVAVLGPGIRGLCTAAAAKEAGAEFVMITGVGPRDVPRLDLASQFGVDLAVDITTQDPARALKEATGGLADVVVDVTANAPAAPGQAVRLARPAGTVVLAGTRGSMDAIGFNPDIVVFKELRILGALGVDAPAYMEALSLLASGKYPFGSRPGRVGGLGDVEALVGTMAGEGSDEIPVHGVFAPEAR